MEKMEPVVTARLAFECRILSIMTELFGILGLSRFHFKYKKAFSYESSSSEMEFFTRIFMDQIQPEVGKKHELASDKYQNCYRFLGKFGLSSVRCKEQNEQFFQRIVWQMLKIFDCELDRTNRLGF